MGGKLSRKQSRMHFQLTTKNLRTVNNSAKDCSRDEIMRSIMEMAPLEKSRMENPALDSQGKTEQSRDSELNEDDILKVVPVTLGIDTLYHSLHISLGLPSNPSSISIPGDRIYMNKILNKNIDDTIFLENIESYFLLLRISKNDLYNLPFVNKVKSQNKRIPKRKIRCDEKKKYEFKLGFSKMSDGTLLYVMFLKASSNNGWRDIQTLQKCARSLVAVERKSNCNIRLSDKSFPFRGSEVKSLVIEGGNKNEIIKCKSLLPKFIQKILICDVQNIEADIFNI